MPGPLPAMSSGAKGVADALVDQLAHGRIAQAIESGLTAPGDAYAGRMAPEDYESRAWDTAGLATLGAGAMPAEAGGMTAGAGIRAYHGSPHSFDRFDINKIGTGEGAQAYGHGLYFAGNEGVARSYRDTLSADGFRAGDGSRFDPATLEHMNLRAAVRKNGPDIDATLARARELQTGANDQTGPMLERDIARLEGLKANGGLAPDPGSMYEVNLNVNPEHLLDYDAPFSKQSPVVQEKLRGLGVAPGEPYEVPPISDPIVKKHIDNAIAQNDGLAKFDDLEMILDNDGAAYKDAQDMAKRLGPTYQSQLRSNGAGWFLTRHPEAFEHIETLTHNRHLDKTGAEMLRAMEAKQGATSGKFGIVAERMYREAAAKAMNDAGVPGLRYLDQGSRGTGEGSHNYVMFDDSPVEILKKYGLVGAAGLPPAVQQYMQMQQAPDEPLPDASQHFQALAGQADPNL